MAYLAPAEFVTKMVDSGESKLLMSTRDTLIRSYMAGAILALAAAFAVTVTVNTGNALVGAMLFPVGFIMLYLMGFDLLTGVFTLAPLAVLDKRPGATWSGVLRNWGLVFCGNFAGALTVAVLMAIIFTFGFSEAPNAIGQRLGHIGEGRTLGYQAHGAAGVSDEFPLAYMWAGNRTLRIADGPDEVHRNAVAKLELSKHMTLQGEDTELPITRS